MDSPFTDSKCGQAKAYADSKLALAFEFRMAGLSKLLEAFDPATASYDQAALAEAHAVYQQGQDYAKQARFHYA